MAEHSLWEDNPTPGITNASDGGAAGVVICTGCLFASGGEVVGVRFRATDTVNSSETYTIAIWDLVSTTLLASRSVSGSTITGGTWNRVDFTTPVAVDSTHGYVVGYWQSAGRYVATVNYFNSHNEGSLASVYAWGDHENISSVVSGVTDARNGQSRVNSALAFPNNFTSAAYFVTPVWEDSPASEVTGSAQMNLGGLVGVAREEVVEPKTVRSELAAQLATISGLRTSAWPTARPSVPHAMVMTEDTTFDLAYNRQRDDINYVIMIFVGNADDRSSYDRYDEYVAGSGARSIKEVLEAGNGTYVSFDIVTVKAAIPAYGAAAGVEYLIARFQLTVTGPGN